MNVDLIDWQDNALDLLLYTKNTRLQGGSSLKDIAAWTESKKMEHLDYMKKTIQSSFEFVNYTFEISGVSRIFTHQLVRTRTASYAQESQRTVPIEDHEVIIPENKWAKAILSTSKTFYPKMLQDEIKVQDARYAMPMGMTTSIVMGADLRTLSHMAELRLCTRTQGEYQKVFKAMKEEVVKVHPWAEQFLEVYCVKTGICAFPNYKECPIQKYTVQTEEQKADIRFHWEQTNHEANPIAKGGKTQ